MELLALDAVLTHPMVLGNLRAALRPRARVLADMEALQQIQQASLREVMVVVEREKLYGLGCGFVDMVLLASTLMTPGTELWTLDKRLCTLAERFGTMHRPALH